MREEIAIAQNIKGFIDNQDLGADDYVVQIVVNKRRKDTHYVGSVPMNGWTERDYILAQLQLEPYMAKIGGPDKVRDRLLRIYRDNVYDYSPMEARDECFEFLRDGYLGVVDMTDEEVMANFVMEMIGFAGKNGENQFDEEGLADYFEGEEEDGEE